jgi:hypothetical protein
MAPTRAAENVGNQHHSLRHRPQRTPFLDVVRHENENACVPELSEAEVGRIVRSAWRYEQEGRNFIGGGGRDLDRDR